MSIKRETMDEKGARARRRIGAGAFVLTAVTLFVANLVRSDIGDDPASILVASGRNPGALALSAAVFIAAAIFLIPGVIAITGTAHRRGAWAVYGGAWLTMIGGLWWAIESVLKVLAESLGTGPEPLSDRAAILDRFNQDFGLLGALLFIFILGLLLLVIGAWRADLVHWSAIAVWVVGFAAGIIANSPLGVGLPGIATFSDATMSILLAWLGFGLLGTGVMQDDGAVLRTTTSR
ncbi:MAG: hypothetical protein ACREOY_10810 [Candidatus Dormibacteraceae bacterium]